VRIDEGKGLRSIGLCSAEEFDERQITGWVPQPSKLPGWGA
jgi:hypothetical protein